MDNIFDIIKKDLSKYNDENKAPKSFTINDHNVVRHYELGEIFGIVCFNAGHILFCDIKEDDGLWYCFSNTDKEYFDSHWIKNKIELYQRMQTWLEENVHRRYYSGFEGQKGMECGFSTLKL